MTVGRKIALIAGVVVLFLVVSYLALMAIVAASIGSMDCSGEVLDQKTSPDGHKRAAIIKHDCGATTSLGTSVLIADVNSAFDDDRDEVATFHGGARRLEWVGSELRVFYGDAEPLKRPDNFRGTAVTYWRAD